MCVFVFAYVCLCMCVFMCVYARVRACEYARTSVCVCISSLMSRLKLNLLSLNSNLYKATVITSQFPSQPTKLFTQTSSNHVATFRVHVGSILIGGDPQAMSQHIPDCSVLGELGVVVPEVFGQNAFRLGEYRYSVNK